MSAPAAEIATRPRGRTPEREHRVNGQPGFVLHSYPYKETSLIVDVFTRDHGRVPLVAKGAKRPHSTLRGVLQTFQPLQLAWSGKSEVRTLVSAEWVGGLRPLERSALLCGFYLNELLVKLLARDDPHPVLFDHYVSALNQLAHDEPPTIVLRKFELALLKETGVAGSQQRLRHIGADLELGAFGQLLVDARHEAGRQQLGGDEFGGGAHGGVGVRVAGHPAALPRPDGAAIRSRCSGRTSRRPYPADCRRCAASHRSPPGRSARRPSRRSGGCCSCC